MSSCQVATVVSFCSNDWRFFERLIGEARLFSKQIIVTVCDHFFDGSPENYALLQTLYAAYPDIDFIEFAYDPYFSYNRFTPLTHDHPLWRHEWHNTGRWISYFFIDEEIDYLYFCDADEITDGKRFCQWLDSSGYRSYDALRLACYWYFRQAQFQALEQDDMCLLVKKEAVGPSMFWDEHERMGLYLKIPGNKTLQMKGLDGNPLVHHYSWVRTQEELKKKFSSWGHFWERDWQRLVQEEFERPFNGVDFIRRYQYTQVSPVFDPLERKAPLLKPVCFEEHLNAIGRFAHVRRVARQEMLRKELEHEFSL